MENPMHTNTLLRTALLTGACMFASSLLAQAPGSGSPQTAAASPNAAFVQ
jgi:hypothetical protein